MIEIKETELDEILEENKCPECKDLIMDGQCNICSNYGSSLCPFTYSDKPWITDKRYIIIRESNYAKLHFFGHWCRINKLNNTKE